MKLFRSHHPDFKDGEQQRDFIYVKDVVKSAIWLMHHRRNSGLYNLGTGQARSFNDLARAVFSALGKEATLNTLIPLSISGTNTSTLPKPI